MTRDYGTNIHLDIPDDLTDFNSRNIAVDITFEIVNEARNNQAPLGKYGSNAPYPEIYRMNGMIDILQSYFENEAKDTAEYSSLSASIIGYLQGRQDAIDMYRSRNLEIREIIEDAKTDYAMLSEELWNELASSNVRIAKSTGKPDARYKASRYYKQGMIDALEEKESIINEYSKTRERNYRKISQLRIFDTDYFAQDMTNFESELKSDIIDSIASGSFGLSALHGITHKKRRKVGLHEEPRFYAIGRSINALDVHAKLVKDTESSSMTEDDYDYGGNAWSNYE